VFAARAIGRFAVDVPYWDEWMFVPILAAGRRGELTAALLWSQHNEHRPVLPRLVWLALADLTGWTQSSVLVTNVVVALATVGVLVWLLARTVRPLAPATVPWIALIFSMISFSLAPFESWASGLQLTVFMSVLAVVLAGWALARWNDGSGRLGLCVGAALAAALSFGGGIVLLWLLPFAVLALPSARPLRKRLIPAGYAGAVAAVFSWLYLAGWQEPSHHPSMSDALRHPAAYAAYVTAYLGAGFAPNDVGAAVAWGGGGLLVCAISVGWLWYRSPAHRRTLVPWLLFVVYALGTGFLTGAGRVGFGLGHALSTRYITISNLFWIGASVVVTLALVQLWTERYSTARALVIGLIVGAVSVMGIRAYATAWSFGREQLAARQANLRLPAECLRHENRAPDACLEKLYPDPAILRTWIAELRRLQVGPFVPGSVERPISEYHSVTGLAGSVDSATRAGSPGLEELTIEGWARDPVRRRPAREVLIVVDGEVVGRAVPGTERPDVATRFGNRLQYSGWRFRVGLFRLSVGSRPMRWGITVRSLGSSKRVRSLFTGRDRESPETAASDSSAGAHVRAACRPDTAREGLGLSARGDHEVGARELVNRLTAQPNHEVPVEIRGARPQEIGHAKALEAVRDVGRKACDVPVEEPVQRPDRKTFPRSGRPLYVEVVREECLEALTGHVVVVMRIAVVGLQVRYDRIDTATALENARDLARTTERIANVLQDRDR
jgi:hypothetical protein